MMISKHYAAVQSDTPKNYVMDIDGVVFYCPKLHQLDWFAWGEERERRCSECGEKLVPFDATEKTSAYAKHWTTLAAAGRGLSKLRKAASP